MGQTAVDQDSPMKTETQMGATNQPMGEIETIDIQIKKDDKRKADTDHKNTFFDTSINKRKTEGVADFKYKNIEMVHSMNTGRPLVKRLDIPMVLTYSNMVARN